MFKKKTFIFFLIFFIFLSTILGNLLINHHFKFENKVKIHYIDVGQGDSSLIQTPTKTILIDTGPNKSEENLINYLKSVNVTKIDYLFITHPHEDHLGNLDAILSTFKVNNLFIPRSFSNSLDFKTSFFLIKKQNINFSFLENDFRLFLDENIYLDVFSSLSSEYEDINDISPMIKLVFQEDSFLFTGDNEVTGELEAINKDISSDFLKIGHHGSSSSTSSLFLNKVNPKTAIISCGKNNSYNHPHKKTLDNLLKNNIKIYRTDQDGSIIFTSFGDSSINVEKK